MHFKGQMATLMSNDKAYKRILSPCFIGKITSLFFLSAHDLTLFYHLPPNSSGCLAGATVLTGQHC